MIKINILFWDGGDKQRLDNTNLSWHYLKKFCVFANENGLVIEPFLFDLSEDKVLSDAIHIPFEKGCYKRSHKINKVIEYHNADDYIFSVMDSDLIINENDYQSLVYLLKKLTSDKFYVFHLNDLINIKGVDFEKKLIDFNQLEYVQRNMEPDLGALFFISINELKRAGGFDENFILYGGEDNILSYQLQDNGLKKVILPVKPIHLPHVNLYDSVKNTTQYSQQLQLVLQAKKNYK